MIRIGLLPLPLLLLSTPAAGDDCKAVLAVAYKAARDTYKASQDADQEAASDAKAAALVLKMFGEGRIKGASEAAKESADAVSEAMQAARTATASLKVARAIVSQASIEMAINAALQASIVAERALDIASDNFFQETGPVLGKATYTAELARIAARTASDAAEVCY